MAGPWGTPSDGVLKALIAIVGSLLFGVWYARSGPKPPSVAVAATTTIITSAPPETAAAMLPPARVCLTTPPVAPTIVRFFFGSQTGCAAGLAKQLARAAAGHNLMGEACDLAEFSPMGDDGDVRVAAARARITAPCVCVFLVASYGDGDPTDNARDFLAWVRDAPESALPILEGLRFTVFGLGNRQYEHFNRTGKTLDAALAICGAKRLFEYGEGDDDANLEDDFETWTSVDFWASLRRAVSDVEREMGGSGSNVLATTPTSKTWSPPPPLLDWRLIPVTAPGLAVAPSPAELSAAGSKADVSSRHLFHATPARITENRELRARPDQGASTRHIVLNLDITASYLTADNLYVCAENASADVESFSAALGLDLDAWFRLEPTNARGGTTVSPLFPTPCSVRTALTRYLDLAGAPGKQLLAALSFHATSPIERARLSHLASPEGRHDFAASVATPQLSIYDIALTFPSLCPPLEALVQILPRLAPRAYTIASSSVVDPRHVAICVSVLDTAKQLGPTPNRRLAGVASNYLSRAAVGSFVQCYVRTSTFKLPADGLRPVILIGPGTGVAPMRAFIHERAAALAAGARLGPALLFFGCRRKDEDYIYRDELEEAKRDGTLEDLILAFSRQEAGKVYVQHRLEEHGKRIWELMSRDKAYIYVCGATKMGADVYTAFEKVRVEEGLANYCAQRCVPFLTNPYNLNNPNPLSNPL